MNSPVRLTIIGDGSSDRCLEPIVQWILDQRYRHLPYTMQYASNLPPVREGLRKRIIAATKLFPCEILIIHRDAERTTLLERTDEIKHEANGIDEPYVPAIPVRMIEAWLLLDEDAIRRAANNPNGTSALDIPTHHQWEKLPDPKETLFTLLRTATGLNNRRLNKFNVYEARIRLSKLIQNFEQLRSLEAFQIFEEQLTTIMNNVIAVRQNT